MIGGGSGIEINPENGVQIEEDQVSEMGGSHLERETAPNEGRWREEEQSIIRPKRRAASGSVGNKLDSGGE